MKKPVGKKNMDFDDAKQYMERPIGRWKPLVGAAEQTESKDTRDVLMEK